MKTLLGLISCSMLIACADQPEENISELQNQKVEIVYSLHQAVCSSMAPGRIHNQSVDLQIDSTVEQELQNAFVEAFEFWGVKVNSITITNTNDQYVIGNFGLADCYHMNNLQVEAWSASAGTALNYPEKIQPLSFEWKRIIMTHEIGHALSLPESTEWSLMNGYALWAGCQSITEQEKNQVQEYLESH